MWGVWRRRRPHRSPAAAQDEIGEEVRDHLRRRAADLVARGFSPEDAARRAAVEFGGIEGYKEQARHAVRGGGVRVWFEHALLEFSRALRRLARTPVFTIFSIISLGVGVGVTTAAYAVLEDFLTPITVGHADQVALLTTGAVWRSAVAAGDLAYLGAHVRSLAPMVTSSRFLESLRFEGQTYPVDGEAVSGAYFSVLGVTPMEGRLLGTQDDAPAATGVIVLGERFWRQRLGANPNALGSTALVGDVPLTVIGIIPDTFPGFGGTPLERAECWIPFQTLHRFRTDDLRRLWFGSRATVFGPLAPGRSIADAALELHGLGQRLDELDAATGASSRRFDSVSRRNWAATRVSDVSQPGPGRTGRLETIELIVALIVVIACTNLASLMLARGTRRHAERVVRASLGASTFRLSIEVALEAFILALTGAAAGVLIAQTLMIESARSVQLGQVRLSLAPSWSVPSVFIALSATMLGFAVFGVMPAWRLSRVRRLTTVVNEPAKLRMGLIGLQVTIASALLLVGGMCVRASESALAHDSGLDYRRLSLARLNFYPSGSGIVRARADEAAILRDLQAQPEFESAAVTSAMPFGLLVPSRYRVYTPEEALAPDPAPADRTVEAIAATPSIFRTLDIAIETGRPLDERDQPGSSPNIVINSALAKDVFGAADPIGRLLLLQGRDSEPDAPTVVHASVVGVAESTDVGTLYERDLPLIFLPRGQVSSSASVFVARCRRSPSEGVSIMLNEIRRVDSSIAVTFAGTGSELLTGDYAYLVPAGQIFGALGAIGMIVACVGLYGVLSEVMSSREHELGVRLALGADPGRLMRMVVLQGMRPVLVGLPTGLFLAMLARKLLQRSGVSVGELLDPLGLCYASVPLLVVALWACYLPARRAARVDPTIVLRDN